MPPTHPTFHFSHILSYLISLFSLSLLGLPLFPFCSSLVLLSPPLFHPLLFLRPHRQTSNPRTAAPLDRTEVGGEERGNGGTRCTVRPMSTLAIFAVVSIPHLAPSSFTGRYRASWLGTRAEPRVDFRFPTEGNDLSSPGLGLPSFGIPYVRWPYALDFSKAFRKCRI